MLALALGALFVSTSMQAAPSPSPSASPPPASAPRLLEPWSPALFENARAGSRLVLLVIGDPACIRCRLEEEEGLRDAETLRLLRQAFIVARVNRHERPDLDDLFTTAVEWLGGRPGYPLAVVLLPDGRPFAGQGAVPAEDAGQQAGLHRLLLRAWSTWTHDREAAEARAAGAAQALQRAQALGAPGRATPAAALRGLRQSFDPRHGGFGEGAAFAPPAALRLLLASLERGEDGPTRTMLTATLDARLAAAGEPRTLAERALLLEACARAHALTGAEAYKRRGVALAEGGLDRRLSDGTLAAHDDASVVRPPIAGWEGLMIGALALSSGAFDRPQDLAAAQALATATLARLGPPARLRRTDAPLVPALLEDYAFLAEGLLRLEAAGQGRDRRWLDAAAALAEAAVAQLLDGSGAFFDSHAGPDAFVPAALPLSLRNGYDGALPSANGVMASVLWRLSRAAAQPRYAEMARRVADAFAGALDAAPRGMEGLAAAVVEMGPPPEAGGPPPAPTEPSLPSSETRAGITFAVELAPGQPRSAVPLPLRVSVTLPAGVHLLAHDPGASDLVGLALSVPTRDVLMAAPPRYPLSRRREGKWGEGAVNVYDGSVAVEVPLRPLSAEGMPKAVRVRIVFQACREQASTCDRPDSVMLDAPYGPPAGR
jgi:hypothetical protein